MDESKCKIVSSGGIKKFVSSQERIIYVRTSFQIQFSQIFIKQRESDNLEFICNNLKLQKLYFS